MKQGAKRRAVRFIILSRAKCTCITRASQGQCDFLLAITLSTLVGVRLDVIQSSDIKVHYGFPGNRLPLMTKLWVRPVFSSVNYLCLRSVNHHPISYSNKRERQTQQRWIQQVAGNPRWERFTNNTPQEQECQL